MAAPPARYETIPPTLKKFDIPQVLLARHIHKYGSNKRTTNKVLTVQCASLYICSDNGTVSRYVPLAAVQRIQYRGRDVLVKMTDDADVLIELAEDKRNTSNSVPAVIQALEECARLATGNASLTAEDLSVNSAKLSEFANLKKGEERAHPMAKLSDETKRVMKVTKVKYDAVEAELSGRSVAGDGSMAVSEGMPPSALARQKALEVEVSYLRQRLNESEQLRLLQAQVDQMQRLIFEKDQGATAATGGMNAAKSVSPVPRTGGHMYRRPQLMKPHMPDYVPGALGSLNVSKQLQLQHNAFSFLGNKDLWNNLVRVVNATTHIMAPPVFTLSASHSGETVLVGMDFLRDFLVGWRIHNAHYVIVKYAREGESTEFYATKDFWKFVGREHDVLILQRQQAGEHPLDDLAAVTVQCDQATDVLRSSLTLWNELVQRWETVITAPVHKLGAAKSPSPARRMYL
jgi:hypothetical protein